MLHLYFPFCSRILASKQSLESRYALTSETHIPEIPKPQITILNTQNPSLHKLETLL